VLGGKAVFLIWHSKKQAKCFPLEELVSPDRWYF
jgi:hypothetical protein